MPDIVDQIKALLGMAAPEAPPPPAQVEPPKPEPEPVPAIAAPAAPAVVDEIKPPAHAAVGVEMYAALQQQMATQKAQQDEAMALLAARPAGETVAPAPPKMPGLLDRKGMEAALRAELGDSASTGDLSFSWVNSNPLTIPDSIARMR